MKKQNNNQYKGFSTVEIIVVVSLIMILGALTYATGKNASSNNKDNEGAIILQSQAIVNQGISMKEDTYPDFPANIITYYPNGKYSYVTTNSTEANIISINQGSVNGANAVVMSVLTGNKCWIMVDKNDGKPLYGVKLNASSCKASDAPSATITSNDPKSPTEVSY